MTAEDIHPSCADAFLDTTAGPVCEECFEQMRAKFYEFLDAVAAACAPAFELHQEQAEIIQSLLRD